MHRLLIRQIKKFLPDSLNQSAEMKQFLDAISNAYIDYEHDYEQLERTLEVSSNELFKSNQRLNDLNSLLEEKVKQRTKEYEILNEELKTEIDVRKNRESELHKTDRLLNATNETATILLTENNYENALTKALKHISEAIGAEQIALFEKDNIEDLSNNYSERIFWNQSKNKVELDRKAFKNIDLKQVRYGEHINQLAENSSIALDINYSALPGHKYFETNNICSAILIPILLKGKIWGAVSFEYSKKHAVWNTIELVILTNFSSSLGGIVQRRNQEEFLVKNRQELIEAQAFAKMGSFEVDIVEGRSQFTENCADLLGLNRKDLKYDSELVQRLRKNIFHDDLEIIDTTIFSAIEKREELRFDFRVHQKGSSETASVNLNLKPEFDGGGKLIKVSGTIQDITERIRNENRIKEYAATLEKINKELDQFAYIVSHDLKAPLRAINNLSIWIEEDLEGKMEPDTQKNFEMLRGRILRLEALINGILQYSRAGRVKNELVDIDMNLFVPDIIQNLAPPEKFKVFIPKDLPHVISEKIALEQVFSNFISNAIKYNTNPNPEIKIEAEDRDTHYYFSVADNGPGIEPEFHQKIFVIFQTLQARDVVESTGVGLAIVKKIIEEQGGKVWVESEKGMGAKFCFTLPKQEVLKTIESI
jgi:signal transduction histidine kinase